MGRDSPSRAKYKQRVDVKCLGCGNTYQVSYARWKRNGAENHEWYCRKCVMNKLSERYKKERSEKINNQVDDLNKWFDNLSLKEKQDLKNYFQTNIIQVNNDKFHQRFERQFSESHLCRSYHLQSKYITSNNDIEYCWDYGIFDENDNLRMVIDLRDEDDSRSQSIPDNILICIITQKNFGKCFDYMCKTLIMNYNEYVENMFEICRSMPFPYPEYNDADLIGAYNSLCDMNCNDAHHQDISFNTRIGDKIIQHFHHSIWHDHRGGELSPYEAWQDDDLLLQIIQNRVIYQTHLNPNKILQGFNIAKKAAKVSVFSAGRAKMIVCKYLNEFDTVFDPFSGYSGRMLGTISAGKRYIGQDISLIHTNESKNIIDYLKANSFNINANITQENVLTSRGEYPCLFTCSPYSDKEQWEDVPVDTRSCDDWIDVCLNNFECKRYVFVVDETIKYKKYVVDTITNKSHFGSNTEYVIIIEGGSVSI